MYFASQWILLRQGKLEASYFGVTNTVVLLPAVKWLLAQLCVSVFSCYSQMSLGPAADSYRQRKGENNAFPVESILSFLFVLLTLFFYSQDLP